MLDATFPSITNLETINLKVTRRVTHQLVTRIFAIFLKEVIQYERIELETYDDDWEDVDEKNEKTIEYLPISHLFKSEIDGKASINLEVWRTADHQQMFPAAIIEGNSLSETDIGRFGLFIPKNLKPSATFSYNNFIAGDSTSYKTLKLFRLSEDELNGFKRESINSKLNNVSGGIYTPHQCVSSSEPCATVLAGHYFDSKFFIEHIRLLKLKLKVYFLGHNLKETLRILSTKAKTVGSKELFLVLSWTPSDIIDGSDEFVEVTMPKCEFYKTDNTSCKFEANSIAVYFNQMAQSNTELASIIRNVKFHELKSLITEYDKNFDKIKHKFHIIPNNLIGEDENEQDIENYYNDIACKWLNNHTEVYKLSSEHKWYELTNEIEITLGGM